MKKTIIMVSLFILSLFFINTFAYEFGSKEDPLITLSYLNDVLYTDIIKKVDNNISKAISQVNNEIEIKIKNYNQNFEDKKKEIIQYITDHMKDKNFIDNITNKINDNKNDWKLLNIPIDSNIVIFKGTEFFLYSGDTVSNLNIINLTKSSIHNSNDKLYICNLYITTDKINIYALSNAKILIHGMYYIN